MYLELASANTSAQGWPRISTVVSWHYQIIDVDIHGIIFIVF